MKRKPKHRWTLFPKKFHPLFALPGHEWQCKSDLKGGVHLRECDGWVLVRRERFPPNIIVSEGKLIHPSQAVELAATRYNFDEKWKMAVNAVVVVDAAADFIKGLVSKKKQAHGKSPSACPDMVEIDQKISSAVELLSTLAIKSCEHLTELSQNHPKFFQVVARRHRQWPVMMSPHPGFRSDWKAILKAVKLGQNSDVEIHASARCGTQANPKSKGTKDVAEALLKCLQYEWDLKKGHIDGEKVPKFCNDTECSSKWWFHGKKRLLQSYPDPEKIEELNRLVTATSRRKYPSRIKSDILKKIEQAFLALAPRPG